MKKIDVLIVGAGISGIGAACHIKQDCPDKTFAIVEAREAIGGTWDFFRYPGIRSDSDMYTMGYNFKPWIDNKALADGESIRHYIREAAAENNIDQHLRTGHRVQAVHWHSDQACWHVDILVVASNKIVQYQCAFLYFCTGYYDYENPHRPEFKGSKNFKGEIVHPQHWTDDIDYANKKVVVIGSGATAVTVVPAMAEKAAHVTMLQRTPSYVLSVDEVDSVSAFLRRYLPDKWTYGITRWKNILVGMLVYQVCTRKPHWAKAFIRKGVIDFLGEQYDINKHFTPSYDPWDQRLCMVPDGDLFNAISSGRASVVTDHVDHFTESGIALKSGEHLDADMIVTATGLTIKLFDGITMTVDDKPVNVPEKTLYRGMMLSDVPNFAFTVGYTNASWTLKADLTAEFIARILNFMSDNDYRQCCPHNNSGCKHDTPMMTLKSGYVERAAGSFPSEGSKAPWKMYQNYILDKLTFKLASLKDGTLFFK